MRKLLRPVSLAAIAIIIAGVLLPRPTSAAASNGSHDAVIRELSRMLIMDNGRIKPLETYARYTLLGISGRSSFKEKPAIDWLGRVMFAGDSTANDAIFLVNNPAVTDAIHLRPGKRFPAAELLPVYAGIAVEAYKTRLDRSAERSPFDKEIYRLDMNLREYLSLTASPSIFGKVKISSDFLNVMSENPLYYPAIVPVSDTNGVRWTDINSPCPRPRESVNPLPPRPFDTGACTLARTFDSAKSAYVTGHFSACADSLRSFNTQVRSILASHGIRVPVELEIFYDRLDPFFWSRLAYFLGLLALCAGLFSSKRLWSISGGAAVAAGLLLHTGGLVLRMFIMHRPPIASFYETFVTVAWIGVVLGLLIGGFMKNRYGLFIATFMGATFLSFSSKFGADGDTLGMLAPLLNSSFWLTSHIMTISTGYAGCVAAGVLGHLYLIRRVFLGQKPDRLNQLDRAMRALLAIGLTFTTIGTVLGGMWAEQAWGRFWGWDPKENGALLIIIWCAIIFHARAGGIVGEIGAAAGAVIGLALVMLAWIGVNLLGVGMHSYGFTAIGAKALIAIMGVETVFLAAAGMKRGRMKAEG